MLRASIMPPRLPALIAALLVLVFAPATSATPAPRFWPADAVTPLSAERIAQLPADQQPAWRAYWETSKQLEQTLVEPRSDDPSPLRAIPGKPIPALHSKGIDLEQSAAWYGSDTAREIADRVAVAQLACGGWKKGYDYTQAHPTIEDHMDNWPSATFDNDATLWELRFLARVIAAAGADEPRSPAWRESFDRGLRYVFAAQYPNGGFPQCYPLIGGYHDAITFNDEVMTQSLELLRAIAAGTGDFAFVPPPLRGEAAERARRGLTCLLAAQNRTATGERAGWAQQYDPLTLRPCAARNFEPVADSAGESANVALFLMNLPDPSAEIVAAIEGVMAWFERTALRDVRWERDPATSHAELISAPGAPPLWARFYEPGTTTPIFGDRDRSIHYDVAEISLERRAGYNWYTTSPGKAFAKFAKWKKRQQR